MENKQKFSVSMAVYHKDNDEWFNEAHSSIFKQTLVPDEVVLVVDGPIPNEIDIIIQNFRAEYNQFKVTYLEKNVGHGEARSIGLSQCFLEILAILDADDICVPNRFEKQMAYFNKHPEISIVGGYIKEFIGDPSNVVGTREVPKNDKDIKEYMKSRCPMNLVTVMFKKEDILGAGGFIDWYCEEDYYLWIRMMQTQCIFKNIDENLVFVRVGQDMYQRRGGWKYFKSEARLQHYMLKQRIIKIHRYLYNVLIRLAVQVLMPNTLRGFIFQKLCRKSN